MFYFCILQVVFCGIRFFSFTRRKYEFSWVSWELGVCSGTRVLWTTFVRSEIEKRGFSWAYWEFGAGFGVYDREAKVWREELLNALIEP